MNARQVNLLLHSASAAVIAAGVGAVVAGVLAPLQRQQPPQLANGNTGASPGATQPAGGGDLREFAAAWSHPLRRPLTDPLPQATPAAVAAESATPPPGAVAAVPALTLAGTIGDSLAMLRAPDGGITVVGVGDTLAGMQVEAIRDGHVDLRASGRLLSLDKPAPAPSPAAIRSDGAPVAPAANP